MDNRGDEPRYAETIVSLKARLKEMRKELKEDDSQYPEIQESIDKYWN